MCPGGFFLGRPTLPVFCFRGLPRPLKAILSGLPGSDWRGRPGAGIWMPCIPCYSHLCLSRLLRVVNRFVPFPIYAQYSHQYGLTFLFFNCFRVQADFTSASPLWIWWLEVILVVLPGLSESSPVGLRGSAAARVSEKFDDLFLVVFSFFCFLTMSWFV